MSFPGVQVFFQASRLQYSLFFPRKSNSISTKSPSKQHALGTHPVVLALDAWGYL